MITIYDSKETNFTHNGLGVLDPIIKSCKVTEVLNGEYYVDLELFKDNKHKYKSLSEFRIIKVKGQLFRLYNLSNIQDRGVSIRSTMHHISNDVNTDYLEELELTEADINTALNAIILDDRFTILSSDITSTNTMTFDNDKPLNAIFKTILPVYEGELKRDNFKIGVVKKIGVDTGIVIEYSKNITGFEQSLDYTGIITRMKPLGADGATIDLINGGSKWINSPRINDYFKTFSSSMSFDGIEDATELKAAGESLWGIIDLPKANYKVNFVDLKDTVEYKELYKNKEQLQLGDSIVIKHKIFNVNITARVIKITRDGYTGRTLEIELGEFRDNLFSSLDKLNYKITNVNNSLQESKKDLYTKVNQTDERITLEAARLDGDISANNAKIDVTAEAIRLEVSEDVTRLDGDISATRADIDISANNIRLEVAEDITRIDGDISSARAAIDVNADNINLKVSKNNVIGELNVSPEEVKIAASRLELSGYATFYSLATAGATVIDGGNIKTNSINFADLYNKPAIPTQYTDNMALSAIQSTYINAEGVWTTKVFANNIQAGTLKSVDLESENMKITGGEVIFEPFYKIGWVQSPINLRFNYYENGVNTSSGYFRYFANQFLMDKPLTVSGHFSCQSLTVNGVTITGNAVVAKFG